MATDGQDDAPNIGLLIFLSYRAIDSRINEAVAAAGYGDMTAAQSRIFQRIAPQGSRLTELAEQAQVTKQSAGFLIDQLEELGYIQRAPDPNDGRARLIHIAERGHANIAVALAAIAEVELEWSAHLGASRMGQLRRALTALREITDPYR